ncbi:MAG: tRNA (adenosine(37)-N6)-threonylcarbamoyltransferase complex dimerization subunit type 1 TsaB [Armatimonadota bacterium]
MNLLSIETSADVCSMAITSDHKTLAVTKWSHNMQLSTRLHSILDQLFAIAQLSPDAVDGYAIGLGPGSFTGTRVAVVMGKTLSVATGKPLYGVDSLQMMAHSALNANPGSFILSLLQARVGEVYAAGYQDDQLPGHLEAVMEPSVHTADSLRDVMAQHDKPIIVVGQLPEGFEWLRDLPHFSAFSSSKPDAELLAAISYKQALDGIPLDALLQMPCYVKQASITVSKRRLVNPFAPN